MTRAALIVLGDAWPTVRVVGLSWPEYRIRSAMRGGAAHIVVTAERVTPDVVAAVDRARGDGISIQLARSVGDVGDLFHPDEAVLLLAGGAIAPPALIDRLAVSGATAVACVPPDADPAFELINATARWSGFASIDGAQVRRTAGAAGDWDLASMLLRKALAASAQRIMLAEGDVPEQADAPGATVRAAKQAIDADGVGAALAARLHRQFPAIALAGPWAVAAVLAAAPVAAALAPIPLGFGLLLVGICVAGLARLAGKATALRTSLARILGWLPDLSAAVTVVTAAWMTQREAAIVAAVTLVVVAALGERLGHVFPPSKWVVPAPALATTVAIGSLFGATGLFAGLCVALACALATLAIRQNSLSATLTSPR